MDLYRLVVTSERRWRIQYCSEKMMVWDMDVVGRGRPRPSGQKIEIEMSALRRWYF